MADEKRTHFEIDIVGVGSKAIATSTIRAGTGLFRAWLFFSCREDAVAVRDAIDEMLLAEARRAGPAPCTCRHDCGPLRDEHHVSCAQYQSHPIPPIR